MHFDTLRSSNIFLAVSIATVAFLLFLVVQPFTLINGDEGIYVMDALKMRTGAIPVADYSARSPLLLTSISLLSSFLGSSIFAFRLSVMLMSALTAGVLFMLGKELFSKRVGIIAGLLYSANPYVLWSDGVIKSEMFTILFGVIGAYCFIRALKTDRSAFFFLAGMMVGLAFLERHSGVALGFVIAGIIFWHRKNIFLRGALASVGFIVGFLPIFGWIAIHNMQRAVAFWFGVSFDLVSLQAERSTAAASGIFSYPVWRDWGLLIVEDLAPQAWILFSCLVIFLCVSAYFWFSGSLRGLVAGAVTVVFGGAFIEHALGVYFTEPDLRPEVFLATLVATIVTTVPLGVFFWQTKDRIKSDFAVYRDGFAVVFLWMVSLVGIYTFWTPTYLRELIVPITLATAFVTSEFLRAASSRMVRVLFGVGVVGLYISSVWWFINPLTGGWWWTQETMNSAAQFIEAHTQPEEMVLSANPLPVMLADRRVFADISSFAVIHARTADDRWSSYPSPNELLQMMKQDPPRYAIVDGRMKLHFFGPYPMFQNFMTETYVPVATFGSGKDETQIWQRVF